VKLLQFGAGNIGRSFIAQLFSRAGYEVVFAEIDLALVALLNQRRRYPVEIKDEPPETIWVENIRAVDVRDEEAVIRELASCDIAATAVGPAALPSLYSLIARGLRERQKQGRGPLDLILAENLRYAAPLVRAGLRAHLPADFPLESSIGLVETSIGKMVPIMPEQERRRDPLLLYAEAYNTLILDRKGFLGPVPKVAGLDPKENIAAYVERKFFIHNLGHAAAAYLGHLRNPGWKFMSEVMRDPEIRGAAEAAMWESARSLILRYPQEFNEHNQAEHISDLLRRFANPALGDTVYRVGRDLPRKLSSDDRLIGALRLDAACGVSVPCTTLAAAAALLFRARDERDQLFAADARFAQEDYPRGLGHVLTHVCGLDPSADAALMTAIQRAHDYLVEQSARSADWLSRFLCRPGAVLG